MIDVIFLLISLMMLKDGDDERGEKVQEDEP
jgi:hypothetical protein